VILTPGWIAEPDFLWTLPVVKPGQEQGAEVVGTRSRDGLNRYCPVLFDRGTRGPENEGSGCRSEGGEACDWEVFVIESGIVDHDLGSLEMYWIYVREMERTRTFFTTGRTHGLEWSSRYAPTPRLILWGNVSAL
jgi:hypothetical protein